MKNFICYKSTFKTKDERCVQTVKIKKEKKKIATRNGGGSHKSQLTQHGDQKPQPKKEFKMRRANVKEKEKVNEVYEGQST